MNSRRLHAHEIGGERRSGGGRSISHALQLQFLPQRVPVEVKWRYQRARARDPDRASRNAAHWRIKNPAGSKAVDDSLSIRPSMVLPG